MKGHQQLAPWHLVGEGEVQPTIILLMSAVLLSAHRAFGSMEFAYLAFGLERGLMASVFMFGSAFVLLGVIPALVIKFGFKENLREYGWCAGNWKEGSLMAGLLLPAILLLVLVPASHTAEMRAFYPFAPEALESSEVLMALELSRGVLFYGAWEFFFRGFMLFGMRRYVGDWLAICIQTIPQCLWHIGMPVGEIFSSILGGVLFGVMAIRTGSIVWPLLLHYAIGVGLDVLLFTQQ